MNKKLIIPFPPGQICGDFEGKEKAALGFYPCMNDSGDCDQYLLVKLNAKGMPYANCSKSEITGHGCNRGVKGIKADIPDQTYDAYQAALAETQAFWPMPEPYKRLLEASWAEYMAKQGGEGNSDDQ